MRAERVPFVGLSPLIYRLQTSGNSIYNSLQATLKKDISHGFQFLAAYTFSKSIDDAGDSLGAAIAGTFGLPITGQVVYNNQNDVAAQRGLSDFDRTHRLVISGTWSVPGPGHAKSASDSKAREWLEYFRCRNAAIGTTVQHYGQCSWYAVWSRNHIHHRKPGSRCDTSRMPVASGSVSSRVNEFFNTKAFVPAPYIPDGGLIDGKYPVSGGGTIFGNLGRNILRGPDQQDFDIAAIKTTPLTDRVKLIFRWEIFNALNRPNFANPSNDVSTPSTFGVISALTVNPRIMQYALKVEF